MDRSNPYEAAFKAYLHHHGLCHVAVDETRRALWGNTSIKSLDFIVLGESGTRLLVDVKGRRFPGGPPHRPRHVWENWSTRADLEGLASWTRLFSPGCQALFVFIYRIGPSTLLDPATPDLWSWRGEQYLIRAVPLEPYRRHHKVRSPRWGTVCLSSAVFQDLARPFRFYTQVSVSEGIDPYVPDPDWFVPTLSESAASASAGPDPEIGGGGH